MGDFVTGRSRRGMPAVPNSGWHPDRRVADRDAVTPAPLVFLGGTQLSPTARTDRCTRVPIPGSTTSSPRPDAALSGWMRDGSSSTATSTSCSSHGRIRTAISRFLRRIRIGSPDVVGARGSEPLHQPPGYADSAWLSGRRVRLISPLTTFTDQPLTIHMLAAECRASRRPISASLAVSHAARVRFITDARANGPPSVAGHT
jgi:hypothetical protein